MSLLNEEFLTNKTDELALYDRQIRLWGQDTQLRLRSTNILVINLGAVATETVKNLVLGGIHSIEILDSSHVKEEDFAAQFFLPKDARPGEKKLPLVEAAIRKLNPRVNLSICTDQLDSKDEQYFKKFDLVIATELPQESFLKINEYTRKLSLPLYVSGMHGMFSYIFTDLIEHKSAKEHETGNQPRVAGTAINGVKTIVDVKLNLEETKELVTVVDKYSPLAAIFNSGKLKSQLNRRQLKKLSSCLPLIFALFHIERPVDLEVCIDIELLKKHATIACETLDLSPDIITDEYLALFSRNAYAEFAPTAAIIGGILAQDVIQYLGGKDSPINNCVVFDAHRSEIPIYYL